MAKSLRFAALVLSIAFSTPAIGIGADPPPASWRTQDAGNLSLHSVGDGFDDCDGVSFASVGPDAPAPEYRTRGIDLGSKPVTVDASLAARDFAKWQLTLRQPFVFAVGQTKETDAHYRAKAKSSKLAFCETTTEDAKDWIRTGVWLMEPNLAGDGFQYSDYAPSGPRPVETGAAPPKPLQYFTTPQTANPPAGRRAIRKVCPANGGPCYYVEE